MAWSAGSQIRPTPVNGFMPCWPGSEQKSTTVEYLDMVHDVSGHDGKLPRQYCSLSLDIFSQFARLEKNDGTPKLTSRTVS